LFKSLNPDKKRAAEPKQITLGLKDYFGELEMLQDSLQQVKVLADNMATRTEMQT